ncbi:hypothetical protein [Okeania sp.]|uniref:hypothetical protein n=1 Tax=Okeania sp. TaxID=3100323 RepID=UPI002B4AFD26|nr:hypothetical protein [Okeania sp.]MEB3343753.1 hypothetical protein [Okeania sp.]
MDIGKKADWSNVYVQATPASYLEIVSQQEYGVPDYGIQYLRPLLKMLYGKRQLPINIVDIGASYGIISTLLLHDLTMAELIDFFIENDNSQKRTWEEIERFYQHQDIRHTEYKFYLSDSSQPAMDFSERVQVCEKAYCFDMRHEPLPEDLKQIIETTDLFIATGSLGYIGEYFFRQIFPIISQNSLSPLFAFVVYRAFYSSKIEKVFQDYNYTLLKSSVPFKKGRKFASALEQENTIASLHQRNIDTVGFEDEGFYACEFYLGVPVSEKERLYHWLKQEEK